MSKLLRLILLVCIAIVSPLDPILAQDDALPYNPLIDTQLQSQRPSRNSAERDLGRTRMDMIVGLPSDVRNDIKVTKKVSADGEKPVIILVYGRKRMTPRQVDTSEELQRKEIEQQAFKEGLRETGINMRGGLQRQNQPEVMQPK